MRDKDTPSRWTTEMPVSHETPASREFRNAPPLSVILAFHWLSRPFSPTLDIEVFLLLGQSAGLLIDCLGLVPP